jgi:uncharacterized protein YecE (DUF72 family)
VPPVPANGRLFVGTSGFAYPAWSPRFYPAGLRAGDLLGHYASRLTAVELNNTFYQQPAPAKVASWLGSTPDTFRFTVKAQRGGSYRSMVDPETSVPWLTGPYRAFGERLGCVLFRVPTGVHRDDGRLAAFLAVWPRDLPLTVEFQEPDWLVDETFAALTAAGAAVCATELPDEADPGDGADAPDQGTAAAQSGPPDIRATGPFLYLRLRRHDYPDDALATWADRLEPFLASGMDAFVFFRHDEVGRGAELALAFDALVSERLAGPRT